MKKLTIQFCAALTVLTLITCGATFAIESSKPPKNIIIVVGDGMGFNAYRAASFYRSGEMGKQVVDSFPVHLSMMTAMQKKVGVPIPPDEMVYDAAAFWSSVAESKSASPNAMVTDSAAAGTAMFTGTKTTDGRVAFDGSEKPQQLVSISETAAARGLAVGSVTSVQAAHATPAAFAAHNISRNNYAEIFTEIYRQSPLGVIIGAGYPCKLVGAADGKEDYQYVGSAEIWNEIIDATRLNIKRPRDLKSRQVWIAPMRKSIPPIDGMSEFAPATEKDALYQEYEIVADAIFPIPTLAELSTAALDALAHQSERGLLLMIEAGAIDWANHDRKINRCVWECVAMFKMIEAVVAWVETNSSWDETLLIVTSDHETGAIWGPGTYEDVNNNGMFENSKGDETDIRESGDKFIEFVPIRSSGAGQIPLAQYASNWHSNALVPLWARGAGAERIRSFVRTRDEEAASVWNYSGEAIDNTDFARFIRACWEE